MREPHPRSHVTLQYCGHVTNKKRYISTSTRPMDSKLSKVVNLGWGNLKYKVTWHIEHVATWQIITLYLHFHKGLWVQNLAGWGLRMRRPHPQGHKLLNQDEGACQNNMSPQPQGYRDVKGKLVLAKNKHKNAN